MTPEQLQTQARRKIRTTARHIAHISRDAGPLALQQLHADLGRSIADLAAANLRAGHEILAELQTIDEVQQRNQGTRHHFAVLDEATIRAGYEVLDEQAAIAAQTAIDNQAHLDEQSKAGK